MASLSEAYWFVYWLVRFTWNELHLRTREALARAWRARRALHVRGPRLSAPSPSPSPRNRAHAAHTARTHAIHAPLTLGERLADAVASGVGSWRFILVQTALILGWVSWNWPGAHRSTFDPFPWILLNLMMSTQAMYTGPVVMLSSNRQAAKDRARDDREALEVDSLMRLNRQQLRMLEEHRALLTRLDRLEELLTAIDGALGGAAVGAGGAGAGGAGAGGAGATNPTLPALATLSPAPIPLATRRSRKRPPSPPTSPADA